MQIFKWYNGVHEGSVLRPLLFIIYINDLVDSCCEDVNIYLFADDAKLYAHITSEQDELLLQKKYW